MVAGPPRVSFPVPPAVLAVAAGRLLHLVWVNDLGGLTYELGSGAERCFCKWTPHGSIDLAEERERLAWAAPWVPVARVLSHGSDATGSWLVTWALPGESAVSRRWKSDAGRAVRAFAVGLRAFHDRLPVETCPFRATPEVMLAAIRRRASRGKVQRSTWHPSHRTLELQEALVQLGQPPPVDALVVCHGDACAPNMLLDDEGRCTGHVDLGALGVADRWADLAIATWSAQWNYGPGWDKALLDAYGVAPDPARTRYYRLLWDLSH